MKCEWCDMDYPDGCWVYYECRVYSDRHIICSDCYEQLRKIEDKDEESEKE